jgi:hypothetical protein
MQIPAKVRRWDMLRCLCYRSAEQKALFQDLHITMQMITMAGNIYKLTAASII